MTEGLPDSLPVWPPSGLRHPRAAGGPRRGSQALGEGSSGIAILGQGLVPAQLASATALAKGHPTRRGPGEPERPALGGTPHLSEQRPPGPGSPILWEGPPISPPSKSISDFTGSVESPTTIARAFRLCLSKLKFISHSVT